MDGISKIAVWSNTFPHTSDSTEVLLKLMSVIFLRKRAYEFRIVVVKRTREKEKNGGMRHRMHVNEPQMILT